LNPAGFSAYEPSAGRARAWVRHLSGDSEAAHAELRAVADDATARALVTQAVLALTDLARLGAASLAVDAFAAFGPLSGAAAERQRFVTAVAGDDGEGLDAAADGFEARGALVLAAEAAALAAGAHRRAGRGRQAELAATRSRALAGRCQALDTPALRDPGAASPLSSREREVAELAAAGRTNRQIAQRLVVSERTVENHLYRVFAKLGISSRDDLTSALRP
jgi:DNA-binding NarL/FixJ family response regulator